MAAQGYPTLRGRAVIVTGGGRGLGREMALALTECGANVLVTAARSADELEATRALAAGHPGRLVTARADVREPHDCERTVLAALEAFGELHCLVNNAGRGMRLVSESFTTTPTKFWETPAGTWREIIDINVNGPFYMARAAVPHFLERGFGKIINVSTSAQTMVRRGYAPYGPSKSALEACSRAWAADLEGSGVSVNVLLPGGATDTALLPDMPGRRGADGLLLSPALMRAPIAWLCADESNGHSGERYIAREWDAALPCDAAAAGARQAHVDQPAIM